MYVLYLIVFPYIQICPKSHSSHLLEALPNPSNASQISQVLVDQVLQLKHFLVRKILFIYPFWMNSAFFCVRLHNCEKLLGSHTFFWIKKNYLLKQSKWSSSKQWRSSYWSFTKDLFQVEFPVRKWYSMRKA